MTPQLRLDVVTIFPDYLAARCASRCWARPSTARSSAVAVHDLRQFTDDVHRTVDDSPYGGGPGMVMQPEPWGRALDELAPPDGPSQPRLIVPTPAGRPFTHALRG